MDKFTALILLGLFVASVTASDSPEDDDVQVREKRAIIQTVSYQTMMNLIEDAQSCCTEPTLIPNTMHQTCAHVYNNPQRFKISAKISGGRNFGFFGSLQSFQTRNRNRESPNKALIAKNYEEYAEHACYADCIYQNFDLVDVSNATHTAAIKMDKIAEFYKNVTDTFPAWEETITNGTAYCEKNSLTKPRSVRGRNGKLCSTYPLKFSICMRKYLISGCLTENTTVSTTCNKALESLQSAQTGFTVQVPRDKPSFDTVAVVIGK